MPPAESRESRTDARHESFGPAACPVHVTHTQALIDNLPYIAMIVLGAAILRLSFGGAAWSWIVAGLYGAYGVLGVIWIMLFVCPYCHFYDTRLCPCGYGVLAARLRPRAARAAFAQQFRRHIPVIVPLWFLPVGVGAYGLWQAFNWPLLAVLVVFALNSFVILPLVSRMYGCKKCPQQADCPWMGGCKSRTAA